MLSENLDERIEKYFKYLKKKYLKKTEFNNYNLGISLAYFFLSEN